MFLAGHLTHECRNEIKLKASDGDDLEYRATDRKYNAVHHLRDIDKADDEREAIEEKITDIQEEIKLLSE